MENRLHTRRLRRISPIQALIVAGLAITLILTVVAAGDQGPLPGDVAVAQGIQDIDESETGLFARTVNTAFSAPALILLTGLAALVLGIYGRFAQMFLVAATTLAHAANAALKWIIDSPRPDGTFISVSEQASGLGFPSGHTMGTVVFSGMIIYLSIHLIRHRQIRFAVQVIAAGQMAAVGFSRIYTGAHWPSDVLGGVLWGLWFLAALIITYHYLHPKLQSWWLGRLSTS